MKILHVFKTYYPEGYGGVQQVIKQIAWGTGKMGVKNTILTLSKVPYPMESYDGSAEVIRLPLNFELASTGFSWQCLTAFKSYASQADIIHYHFPWPFADLMHFYAKITLPCLLTYHSDIIKQRFLLKLYSPLMHMFLRKMSTIVATSPNYVASSAILNKYQNKVRIIPIGLDQNLYPEPSTERLSYWREKLGEGFFLFVGVLRAYKGLHILLDACKNTNFRVVIVGQGPMERNLKAQARELKLSNVRFMGALADEDKIALFKLSKAIVFPSHIRSEAFGVSLLEGAMFGKPLISAEIATGSSYVNIHDKTGLIVPPEDPLALRNAMQCILEESRSSEKGSHARARYEELFTADKMALNYLKLYHELLNS